MIDLLDEANVRLIPEEISGTDTAILQKNNLAPVSDVYGATPLEDRHGRSLWIQTRMCYCSPDAPTDCRFHSPTEKGWEICPTTREATEAKRKGRWLWARNPLYGKPITEQEITTKVLDL